MWNLTWQNFTLSSKTKTEIDFLDLGHPSPGSGYITLCTALWQYILRALLFYETMVTYVLSRPPKEWKQKIFHHLVYKKITRSRNMNGQKSQHLNQWGKKIPFIKTLPKNECKIVNKNKIEKVRVNHFFIFLVYHN